MFPINLTYIIIGINVIAFFYLNNRPEMAARWMLIPDRVRRNKEYDRLLLSGFAHVDPFHILFNMITLYFFGPYVEAALGVVMYLILYTGAILAGNLFCMYMRDHDQGYAALGASGGIMGLIYAWIFIAPESSLSLFFLPIPIPGWLFGIIFTITSILLSQSRKAEAARISHEAHLGGACFGGLFVFAMVYFLSGELSMKQIWFVVGGILPILLFGLMKVINPGLLYRKTRR